MRILLSGSSGFVGSNLLNFLNEQNILVHSLSRDELNSSRSDLSMSADVFIHLAGKAHDIKNAVENSGYYEINTNLTKNIYDDFLRSNAKVFITLSSVKAVADQVYGELKEEHNPDPISHYGKSKLLAEQYIMSKLIPPGKRVYILRPCMIHGPGNKGNLNLLYQVIKKGLPWPLAAFQNKRSFCSVENICFVIKELLAREDIPSGIYNMADDEALSTNQVIELIGESMGKRVSLWHLSKPLIKLVANLGDLFHLPLNSERLQKLTESYVVSNAKLIKALGKPLPVSASDGLRSTLRSFQSKAK